MRDTVYMHLAFRSASASSMLQGVLPGCKHFSNIGCISALLGLPLSQAKHKVVPPAFSSHIWMQRALLRTAQEVAKGMDYIHSFGIIHGDLKPGNVLLKTHRIDRRGYIAKVSDFGAISWPVA